METYNLEDILKESLKITYSSVEEQIKALLKALKDAGLIIIKGKEYEIKK